jgi:hypothetical protein
LGAAPFAFKGAIFSWVSVGAQHCFALTLEGCAPCPLACKSACILFMA